MKAVSNGQLTTWYGAPCNQPLTRVKIAGNLVTVNKKAARLFRWQERVFKSLAHKYWENDLNERQLDDWGYNCRNIAGTSIKSVHAWGLAVDIDADENVRGQTLENAEIWQKARNAVRLLEETGFTWGGRFSTPDTHHFQVAVSAEWIKKRFWLNGRPKGWYYKHLRAEGWNI